MLNIPDVLVSETSDGTTVDGDFLIRAFFDTLGMIHTLLSGDEERKTIPGVEGYSTQLLSDFVRILFLANKSVLGKSERGQVQIWYITNVKEILIIAAHLVTYHLISTESDMWWYMTDLCPSFPPERIGFMFPRIHCWRYLLRLRFVR